MRSRCQMIILLALLPLCRGFLGVGPSSIGWSLHRKISRSMAVWDDAEEESVQRSQLRMDVRNFLTQRAVQSFMFLLDSCRDPHTVKWLEETYGFNNLLHFHGSGAFDLEHFPEWNSLLLNMTGLPSDVIVVRTKSRGKGWSKNNPYVEEIDIDPPALVNRIVSVRDQIAKEWVVDLDTLVLANDMILESYIENTLNCRTEECEILEAADEIPEDCEEVEQLLAAYSEGSEKKQAYERKAMILLGNTLACADRGSSPIRKGNFDLLALLATQEAVHRVLRQYRDDENRAVSFEWLKDFYVKRVASFFDGNQHYGRADDFLEELLLTPPALKTTKDAIEVIDPLRIAEDVIVMRTEVAVDWKKIMIDTHKDHMEIQRLVLDARMGKHPNQKPPRQKVSQTPATAVVKEEGEKSFPSKFSNLDDAGVFE